MRFSGSSHFSFDINLIMLAACVVGQKYRPFESPFGKKKQEISGLQRRQNNKNPSGHVLKDLC
jgi:hypothetical protein